MNSKQFIWHAKKGHGECIYSLKHNIGDYKLEIKKIVLNNYSFIKNEETRSAYAYELSLFCKDIDFVELIFDKLERIKISDDYTFVYLVDNLYFYLRNNIKNYEKRILKILFKHLKGDICSQEESNSICALISLIMDLKIECNLKNIIDQYYEKHINTRLDLSLITLNYGIEFIKQNTIQRFDFNIFNDIKKFIDYIKNDSNFNKAIPYFEYYLSDELKKELIEYYKRDSISNELKIKIAKVFFYSKSVTIKDIDELEKLLLYSNSNVKKYIYEILCRFKTNKIRSLAYSLIKSEYKPFGIRMLLKNYENEDYMQVHSAIRNIRINYKNDDNWYDVEESLIEYFKRRKVDFRLLKDIKYFMINGLSSFSRYQLVRILKKYNKLSLEEMNNLKYDANWKIRKMFRKIKENLK